MLKNIVKCKRCNLCNNQIPLLDSFKECNLMWVGLSAKKVVDVENDVPLSEETDSGKILRQIEEEVGNIVTYRTNLVKCLPLDENNKLRSPNKDEKEICFENLLKEIERVKPKLIFLLGNEVTISVKGKLKLKFNEVNEFVKVAKYKEIKFVSIYHPSYVCHYRPKIKGDYIEKIKKFINNELEYNFYVECVK